MATDAGSRLLRLPAAATRASLLDMLLLLASPHLGRDFIRRRHLRYSNDSAELIIARCTPSRLAQLIVNALQIENARNSA